MLFKLFDVVSQWRIVGVILAFGTTVLCIRGLEPYMPCDQGRAFAVEGGLSKGKARGIGLIFVLSFLFYDFIFNDFAAQRTLYFLIILGCMLTGYFDDAAKTPWNEYFKGLLDLFLGIATAVVYLYYRGNSLKIGILSMELTLPYWLYGLLIVILVWAAINVTNCTDGVDGLSATLVIITLFSFYSVIIKTKDLAGLPYSIMLFIAVLIAYLWYNCNPSTVLMGDAGSRAMGIFVAMVALESGFPLLYIPFSMVIILDGGLGLLKVALLRFLKIKILVNVKCPLHDNARHNRNWSNTQVVFRFAIIQACVSLIFVWALDMLR